VNEGFNFVNEKPKEGADNKLICFMHPKDTNGVLIELCMEKK
jgi:methylmalonyl-CoA/ethylmalonyl-CoA epimerase